MASNDALESFISVLAAQFLSVGNVSNDVVDKAFEGNFCEYGELDDAVESTMAANPEFAEVLDEAMAPLEALLEAGTDQPIFDRLANEGIPAKKFLTVLWMAVEESLKDPSDISGLRRGAYASRMYMLFSCLNGAQAFEIFNRFLYIRIIELLRNIYRLIVFKQQVGSGSTAKGKGKKKKNGAVVDNADNMVEISAKDYELCRKLFLYSLDGIYTLLGNVSLSGADDAILATSLLLRDAIRIDLADTTNPRIPNSYDSFKKQTGIADKCFGALHRLVDDRHRGRKIVIGRVLLPRIMCYGSCDEVLPQTSVISSHMLLYREVVMSFLKTRVELATSKEFWMVYSLIQNAFRCPDRSDYKNKVSECVIQLLRLIPVQYHYNFVQFLNIVYGQPMGSMRSFVVEVLPLFINAFDLSGPEPDAVVHENTVADSDEDEDEHAEAEKSQHEDEDADSDDSEVAERSRRAAMKRKRQRQPMRAKSPLPKMHPVEGPIHILIEAVYDKSSSIRSKAVVHLGELICDPEKLQIVEKICDENMDVEEQRRNESDQIQKSPSPLLLLFLSRCDDEKVAVRKAGLIALGHLFESLSDDDYIQYALNEMADLTRDMSVMVRKQAAETLSEVFKQRPECEQVRKIWLDSVMPMLIDREQSVQQLASKIVMEIIFTELNKSSPSEYVWLILEDIEKDFNVRRLLYRAMRALQDQSLLPQSLVKAMMRFTEDESKAASVWLLLSFLSKMFNVEPKIAYNHWFTLRADAHRTLVPTYVCNILIESYHKLTEQQADTMKEDLKARIIRFDVKESNIPALFYLYAKLNDAVGEEATGHKIFFQFCKRIVSRVSNAICEIVYGKSMREMHFDTELPGSQAVGSQPMGSQPSSERGPTATPNYLPGDIQPGDLDISEEQIVAMLQMVGECVQYEPKTCDNKVGKVFKYIFASDYALSSTDQLDVEIRANLVMSELPPETRSQPLTQATQKFMRDHRHLTSLSTRRVRAVCAITMCRICLQHEKLAKECIPVFARELRNNRDHIIRNNLIVGISDLCVRYTLMVDRYSTVMALCLTDTSVFVRQQTITLLTILIKEQFLKCEGQILYKLIATLIDANRGIRDYLYFCLVEVLLVQFPDMFFNHFVECLFYFNGAEHRHQTAEEKELQEKKTKDKAYEYEHMKSNIQGQANLARRMRLYKFMLGTMNDTQRFAIWARLMYEVSTPVSEGSMDLSKRVYENILIDSLNVMCCEEMKMHSVILKKKESEGENEEEVEDRSAQNPQQDENAADNRVNNVKAQFLRRGISELIIPGMLSLRAFLTEKRSPILKLVVNVFLEIARDFEDQIDFFFASDRQAKAELLFDLRRAKEQEEQERQQQELAQATAVMKITNTTRARSVLNETRTNREVTPVDRHPRAVSADMSARRTLKRQSLLTTTAHEKSMIYDENADVNPLADYTGRALDQDSDLEDEPPSRASILLSPVAAPSSPASSRSTASSIVPFGADGNRKTLRAKRSTRTRKTTNLSTVAEDEAEEGPTPKKAPAPAHSRRSLMPEDTLFGRAISTPDGTVGEVTFRMDLELSSIMPATTPRQARATARKQRNRTSKGDSSK